MTKLINLTPHAITFVTDMGTVTLPPSGRVARVGTTTFMVGTVLAGRADCRALGHDLAGDMCPDCGGRGVVDVEVPLTHTTFGEVVDLPEAEEGVLLVVSAMVVAACPSRRDLWGPGDLVRDEANRVVGCRGLTRPAA